MEINLLAKLGSTLRQLRLSKHMTQRELALFIDRHPSYISNIETGSKIPPLNVLVKIDDVFDVSVDELVGLVDIGEFDPSNPSGIVRISKYIEFSPEHYQAGLSILTYFNTVLRQQVPETKATVRIEQEGLSVRLVIESPSGERQVIEKTLHEYGLVITGKLKPGELLPNPQHVIQLENKLEIAHAELRMVQRQLEFEREGYADRTTKLEDEVTWLRQQVGGLLVAQRQEVDALVGAINHLAHRSDVKRDEALVSALLVISQILEQAEDIVNDKEGL